jgi:glycerol-3-phosphate acyltransferase PlsY
MPTHWLLLGLIPLAYLIGSVPFGLIIGRARGIDPRKAGSGNIGATNLGRLLGGRFFALVFCLDLLKGLLPTALAAALLHRHSPGAAQFILWLLVGFAAILGHMFSIFLGFKGGKGVATSCGVLLGVFPYYTLPGIFAIALWIVLFLFTRYVSVASMAGATAFPVLYLAVGLLCDWPVFGRQLPLGVFAILVAVMILVKHRSNISRLRTGTENRFGRAAVV